MENTLPDAHKLTVTRGLLEFLRDTDTPAELLYQRVLETYEIQPDENTDGGNDKHFFSFKLTGQKFFAAENEVGGLTAMLPEEY